MRERRNYLIVLGLIVAAIIGAAFLAIPGSPIYRAPTKGLDVPVELTTPTGAALLAALVTGWGPMPPMRLETSGFGAGTRELMGIQMRPDLLAPGA